MKLNLKRPLVVFDLETTGLDLVNDRIIQLSYIKVSPDGTEKSGNELINPGKEIPKEVTDLTGITNEMVKDAPTFKQRAADINREFTGCDFCGYNSNRFDGIPTRRHRLRLLEVPSYRCPDNIHEAGAPQSRRRL